MKIRFDHSGRVLSWLVRAIGSTIHFEVTDAAGVLSKERAKPLIWAFWHNRLFLVPYIKELWLPQVAGCILTSPSADGQVIADLCAAFGLDSARGSSSKPEKGMSALIKLADRIKSGSDVGITPDGPRGPRYVLGPGILKLSQITGAGIVPIKIQYDSYWQFNTWDHFRIPKPFSTVKVEFCEPTYLDRRTTESHFNDALTALKKAMET